MYKRIIAGLLGLAALLVGLVASPAQAVESPRAPVKVAANDGNFVPGANSDGNSRYVVHHKQRGPDGSLKIATYYVDEGHRTLCYTWDDVSVPCDRAPDVKIGITTRAWSGTPGGIPSEVDAAGSFTRLDNFYVKNIQIDKLELRTGVYPNDGQRAVNDRDYNSSVYGNPVTSETPSICVSAFGTGSYWARVYVSWRDAVGTLYYRGVASNYGPARYKTISC